MGTQRLFNRAQLVRRPESMHHLVLWLNIVDRQAASALVVAFVILPLFAFANAGLSLAGMSIEDLTHPVTTLPGIA